MNDKIIIKGAKENNLKDINLTLPRDKFIVFTGLSGSGKSSLAFDTIFAEGQRRYIESLSLRQTVFGQMDKPDVESIEGLSPSISIDQNHIPQPAFDGGDGYRDLRLSGCCSPDSVPIVRNAAGRFTALRADSGKALMYAQGTKIMVWPHSAGRKGEYKKHLKISSKDGYARVKVTEKSARLTKILSLTVNANTT